VNLCVAFLLSGFFGFIGCTLYDTAAAKVISAEDAKHQLNLQVLGTVPKFAKSQLLLSARSSGSPLLSDGTVQEIAETSLDFEDAIRHLRNTVDLCGAGSKLRSLLLTSAVAGEGKSTIASGLAFAYATAGRKTLVIDADLRRPSLHTLFGTSRESGLADVLSGTASWQESLIKVAREPLYFLPAGKLSRRALDRIGEGLPDLLQDLAGEFDLVIIDGPPLLGVPETIQLAKCAGGVLMVARSGSAKVPLINEASSPLIRVQANVVGLVINQVKQDRLFKDLRYYRPAVTEAA
jgi:tyrosine-protein kinase Etk/Wzc